MRETIWLLLVNMTPTLNLLLGTVTGLIALFQLFARKGLWVRLGSLVICLVCYVLWLDGGHQIGELFRELLQLLGALAALTAISRFCVEEIGRKNSSLSPKKRAVSMSYSPKTPPTQVGSPTSSTLIAPSTMAFCVVCQESVPMNHPRRVRTKNGRWRLKDTCPYCGTKTSRFTS